MAKSRMDETNIAIIRLLKDGRKSYRESGEELSLTENTVRARVNRMIEEGSISITCLVDPESLRGHKIIFIGVKLKTVDLVRIGKEFLKLKGVISVAVVTGRFDLIVQVLLSEDFDLLQFYTEEMIRIKEVREVETFVVYKGYELKAPYIL